MKRKHGNRAIAGVLDWQENYGFPAKGTLSVTMLNKVKVSMEKHKEKLKSKKKKDRQNMHFRNTKSIKRG